VHPNVICLHEQDNGIGWKHTNWRTGRAVVSRMREFVVVSCLNLYQVYVCQMKILNIAVIVFIVRGVLSDLSAILGSP
jgi:hypothetical protein